MLRHQGQLDESRLMSEIAIERLAACPTFEGDVSTRTETMGNLYRDLGTTLRELGRVEDAVDAMLSGQEHFDLVAAERARQESVHPTIQ